MMPVDLSRLSDCCMPLRITARARDESGQGLIEYAMLAALVSIVALFLVIAIGSDIPQLFAIPLNAL
jgi:Flp pilus assembly pilin Flp